ncbi:MAG TPA: hypothetical protein VJ767_05315 [Nitrososphaeraceae archaeon]|nr:hypothetical protein [Nitrososphaeraceae archaeon]
MIITNILELDKKIINLIQYYLLVLHRIKWIFKRNFLLYLNLAGIQHSFTLNNGEQALSIPSPSLPRKMVGHIKYDTTSGCANWQC